MAGNPKGYEGEGIMTIIKRTGKCGSLDFVATIEESHSGKFWFILVFEGEDFDQDESMLSGHLEESPEDATRTLNNILKALGAVENVRRVPA